MAEDQEERKKCGGMKAGFLDRFLVDKETVAGWHQRRDPEYWKAIKAKELEDGRQKEQQIVRPGGDNANAASQVSGEENGEGAVAVNGTAKSANEIVMSPSGGPGPDEGIVPSQQMEVVVNLNGGAVSDVRTLEPVPSGSGRCAVSATGIFVSADGVNDGIPPPLLESGEVNNLNDDMIEMERQERGEGRESVSLQSEVVKFNEKLQGFGQDLDEMGQFLDVHPAVGSKKERFQILKGEIRARMNELGVMFESTEQSVENEAYPPTKDCEIQTTPVIMEVDSSVDIQDPAAVKTIRICSEILTSSELNDVLPPAGSSAVEVEAEATPHTDIQDIQQQTPAGPSHPSAHNNSNQSENETDDDDFTPMDTDQPDPHSQSTSTSAAPGLRRSARKVRRTFKLSRESGSEKDSESDDESPIPRSRRKMIPKPAGKRRLRGSKSKRGSATMPPSGRRMRRNIVHSSALESHPKSDHPVAAAAAADFNEGLTCPTCNDGKIFKTKEYLERHIAYMHSKNEDKPFPCDQCDKRFLYNSYLLIHIKKVHETVRYNCPHCERWFCVKIHFSRHLETHTGHGHFSCKVCSKKFPNENQLAYHSRVHLPKEKVACTICGKVFEQKRYLDKHIGRVHRAQRKLECGKCGKKFKLPWNLKVHMTTHSKKKPYICPICGKGFNQKSSAIYHMVKTYDMDKEEACQRYYDGENGKKKGKVGGAKP